MMKTRKPLEWIVAALILMAPIAALAQTQGTTPTSDQSQKKVDEILRDKATSQLVIDRIASNSELRSEMMMRLAKWASEDSTNMKSMCRTMMGTMDCKMMKGGKMGNMMGVSDSSGSSMNMGGMNKKMMDGMKCCMMSKGSLQEKDMKTQSTSTSDDHQKHQH